MKTSLQQKSDPSDAKRWLIIGAYQAGASEKSVARIAGLSKTAVRNIILNYKRTGTPCLPKRESKKVRQKLLVEYDEEGNALVSDDDDENDNDTVRAKSTKSSKIRKQITTKDILEYMMDQVRQVSEFNGGSVDSGRSFGNHDDAWSNASPVPEVHDEKMAASYRLPSPTASESSSEACKSQKPVLDAHQQQQAAMAPPSPVASHHSPSDTDAASPSALWCPTPPSDSHNHLPLAATPTPHHPNDHDDAFFMSHPAATAEPAAVLKTPAKYDQTIRGYELWTSEDDVLLLQHVLSRLQLGNWRELEAKFHGRHTARLCSARWYYLRDQLLRGIAKST